MIRTYDDALAYLKSREKFGIKFGLSNIDHLAEVLGRPERQFPSVLIAGTNGKGSTAALLQSILTAGGLRTGRYTSPHIRFLEERIQVDGRPIERDALASVVARVADASRELNEPTFFEAVTASVDQIRKDHGQNIEIIQHARFAYDSDCFGKDSNLHHFSSKQWSYPRYRI